MADTMASQPAAAGHGADGPADPGKRDFVMLTAGAFAAVAVGGIAWPFISQMNPAADVLALSSTEADLAPIAVGQAVTVVWRGKPVFLRHRTPAEIEEARTTDLSGLRDPQPDAARVQKAEWLILVGICTHLGCVPLGQKSTDQRGDFGGWFCPCHGSHYDTSGRIRKGPAPANLAVPGYTFTSDKAIRIG
jgi:ubiquinol-cytochrome c reductase iron-sulfur subunit